MLKRIKNLTYFSIEQWIFVFLTKLLFKFYEINWESSISGQISGDFMLLTK